MARRLAEPIHRRDRSTSEMGVFLGDLEGSKLTIFTDGRGVGDWFGQLLYARRVHTRLAVSGDHRCADSNHPGPEIGGLIQTLQTTYTLFILERGS